MLDLLQGEVAAWVSSCDRVVVLLQNLAVDLYIIGHVELLSVVY